MYGKKIVYYTISLIAILSMLLAACQSEPEVVVTEEPVAETEAPAVEAEEPIVETEEPVVVTEEPIVEAPKKVLTLIWTQEFDSLNPLYSNMWFSIVT